LTSGAEIILLISVILVFFLGIYGFMRFRRWNQKDKEEIRKRNEARLSKKD